MRKAPITRQGYERLYWQLQYLKRHARRDVARGLEAAREQGLTIRNLEWRTAREKQWWVESRIDRLERMLMNCEVIVHRLEATDRARFGFQVRLRCAETGRERVYQLVGPYESDVSMGKLSIDSPAGQAVFGRAKGEAVTFLAPSGLKSYQILEIMVADD